MLNIHPNILLAVRSVHASFGVHIKRDAVHRKVTRDAVLVHLCQELLCCGNSGRREVVAGAFGVCACHQ